MLLKRKEFLRIGSLATASFMVPKFLKAFEGPYRVPPGNKVLVILQLSGGNDGLNTVIPVRNDIYYQSRPRLGITKDKALLLTDEVGLNPALSSLKSLYDDGSLGILNNVGRNVRSRPSHMRLRLRISPVSGSMGKGSRVSGLIGGMRPPLWRDDVLNLRLEVISGRR